MAEPTIDTAAADDGLDAYALLSRPTLELTDAQVERIVVDLRARRAKHIATGKPDKPKAEAKAKAAGTAPKPTAADKAAATADLLSRLSI